MKLSRRILGLIAAAVFAAAPAFAAEITFSISGMDPVQVMRFSEDPSKVRIGYVQSTEFSHSVREKSKQTETFEDGIFYYSVVLEKLPDGKFQMDISYDFSSADGKSRGIRSRSVVNEEVLKSITEEQIQERSQAHADEFSKVVYDEFLKNKLVDGDEKVLDTLRDFFKSISEDLLKSMPKDGVMIIRRWSDLQGK